MRRLQHIAWLSILLIGITSASSATAQKHQLSGRITDENSNPIAYATVVLLDEGDQVAGGSTDDNGGFLLQAATGDYTLHVSYVGYKSHECPVSLSADLNIGDIAIESDIEEIDEVVVTGQLIDRKSVV